MNITIRPYQADDAARIVEIINRYNPMPTSVEQFQWQESRRDKEEPFYRLVAEDRAGRVMGYGTAHLPKPNPKDWWTVRAVIDPADQRRSAGRMLYDAVVSIAQEAGAVRLESSVRDNDPDALAWVERRGWAKERHVFESVLDVAAFDPGSWAPARARPAQFGIRIDRFGTGRSEEEMRKLFDLSCRLYADMPGMDNRGTPTYDQWRQYLMESPDSDLNGTFIAVDGDDWVGVSGCTFRNASDAYTWFTGTLAAYRGKGIAMALKLSCIEYVQAKGRARMWTNNDSENPAMLRINEKLGYQAEPGWYQIQKAVGS